MRHALVIARRELGEKRFVALAATAFAVLPFLLATIPVIRGRNGPGDIIATGAGLLAIGFTLGLALVLGGNVIGRDLAESRLSFYFSRPVGAASIWFGKVVAAVTLIAGVFLIIILPARIAAAAAWAHSWGKNAALLALAVVGLAVVLFFVAHVIGSFVRSRSAWIAIDFAALCLAALAAYLILRPLFEAGAMDATKTMAIAIGCGVAVALIGGGAWQLERGRTDRKRNHTALSQFLWVVIGATLAITAAFVAWMVSAKPEDLKTVNAEAQHRGPWVLVTGDARGRMDYRPAFVYNTETGAYNRFGAGRLWRSNFSRDGRLLFVSRVDRKSGTVEILKRPVTGGAEESTGLTVHLHSEFTLTDDGDRIAALDRGLLTVYDVAQKRSLGSARLPEKVGEVAAMYFASPTLVRVLMINIRHAAPQPIPRTLRVFEFDAVVRTLRQTGEFTRDARYLGVSANQDGSRLLVRHFGQAVYVLDGRTAALQLTLAAPESRGVAFLHDGGIALNRQEGDHVVIDLLDREGNLVRTLPLPAARTWSARELRDGRLLVIENSAQTAVPWTTLIVAPTTGAVQRIPATPVSMRMEAGWGDYDPRRERADVPRIYRDANGRLIRWDYKTNKAEVLLPKG